MGTLGGFPNPPALWLRRAEPASASAVNAEEVPLMPEELAVQAGFASEKRRREFGVGRRCARVALGPLGIREFALLPGKDRAPVWPADVVGSITHTESHQAGYCGVAVARRDTVRALGVDAEPRHDLPRDLWAHVLDEIEQRATLRAPEPGIFARLVFSAKEAVYKAIYPVCRQFLDFTDVHIECDLEASTFRADVRGPCPGPGLGMWIMGRFVIDAELIMTGVALTASSLQLPDKELSPQHSHRQQNSLC
jgi:4'-phosphopantetheinyl transferase EntD